MLIILLLILIHGDMSQGSLVRTGDNLQTEKLFTILLYYSSKHNIKMYPQYGSNNNNLSPNNYQQSLNPNQRLSPQPGSLMPPQQGYGSLAPPQPNRAVYTSMISPQNNPPTSSKPMGGFGGLSGMGRVVKEEPDPIIRVNEAPNTQPMQSPNTLSFRNSDDKPKMANSMIFPQQQSQNSFSNTGMGGFGTSRLDAMMGKGKSFDSNAQQSNESAEDKRKREIGNIKEELNKLNKRMENFSFKQADPNNPNKQYFQLPTRKSTIQQSPTSDQDGQGGHFGMFKAYSGSNSNNSNNSNTSNSSGSSSGYGSSSYNSNVSANNQSWQNKLQESHSNYLGVKPQTQMQHSLSANELRKPEFKREEPGTGMFKKKSSQFDPQAPQNGQAPRTFMLSPKSHNTTPNNANLPPKPTTPKIAEFRAAEVVDVPQPKKMVKRIDSITHDAQEQPRFREEKGPVKEFKRSDFIVGKKMGKGQFGEVMMVVHKDTGFLCAMKVMSKKQIKEEKYQNQIARQLSIQFYLSHRNVSPLYGYFTDAQNIYLLLQYATGGQLLEMLRKAHRMEEADCSPIIREICEGLNYIHNEQIIHRDIKPENILFNFDTVKICDFGWAVHSGNGMRKTVAGSPLYYSPQIVKEAVYDEKIDIWAIGMMTYECILGKIPFRIYSQLDLNRIVEDEIKFPEYIDTTEEVRDFILRICKKDPDERMELRDIMRHPFITKYQNKKKIAPQILEEFRKFLSN